MKVRDIMSTPVRSVTPETPVRDVLRLMVSEGITGLPVVDAEGKLVGFIPEGNLLARVITKETSAFDINRFVVEQRRLYGSTARDVMNPDPVTIEDYASLTEAIELMLKTGLSRLPVTRRGKLVGFLTRGDILRAVLEMEERRADRSRPPSDDEIRREVVEALHRYLGVTAISIKVRVEKGVVFLAGTVNSAEDIDQLVRLVSALPGVKRVDHKLLVDRLLD
jgi:CBS domain-containing protein